MSDYSQTKGPNGKYTEPESVIDAADSRYEPLINAQDIRDTYLFGISLKSPETGQVMTDTLIEENFREDAITELEEESHLIIRPTQVKEGQPFDRNEYMAMGYFRLKHRPVSSIEQLQIVTSNQAILWTVSIDWIDTRYLAEGLVYIVPINVAVAPSAQSGGAAGGAAFLAILGQQSWVSAFWNITYTLGYKDEKFPRNINMIIGLQTAINICSELQAANARNQSKSISQDGLSQSSSNAGPEIYAKKIEQLELRKKKLIKKLKNKYGMTMFSGNV